MVSFKKSKAYNLQAHRTAFADHIQYLYTEIIRLHQQLKLSQKKIVAK